MAPTRSPFLRTFPVLGCLVALAIAATPATGATTRIKATADAGVRSCGRGEVQEYPYFDVRAHGASCAVAQHLIRRSSAPTPAVTALPTAIGTSRAAFSSAAGPFPRAGAAGPGYRRRCMWTARRSGASCADVAAPGSRRSRTDDPREITGGTDAGRGPTAVRLAAWANQPRHRSRAFSAMGS